MGNVGEYREAMLEQAWAGVDVGKEHHHCVVIDAEGRRLLSRRVANDEAVLLDLISDVTGLAGQVRWAVDISTGEAALLLALLAAHDQPVSYLSGHQVNRAAGGYRGSGKTDAKPPRSSPTRPGCGVTWPRSAYLKR